MRIFEKGVVARELWAERADLDLGMGLGFLIFRISSSSILILSSLSGDALGPLEGPSDAALEVGPLEYDGDRRRRAFRRNGDDLRDECRLLDLLRCERLL